MKSTPSAFDTSGKLRDARRLHSMTLTSSSRAKSWMLTGPVTSSDLHSAAPIRHFADHFDRQSCGGSIIVASPE